jgi:hypothetical protein
MTTLIEVELPRYTITPLERNCDDYWCTSNDSYDRNEEHHGLLERAESTLSMVEEGRVKGFLRGGSWRAFHWRKLIVGKKLYRIQYEDELREPAAEIDFSDLVNFLLDWGAVPDSMGWEKLRSSGLWTPAGTVLLRKADAGSDPPKKHLEWVLRTSVPDESDGVLSLTIKWSKDMDSVLEARGASSLPPGWGRLIQPPMLESGSHEKPTSDRQSLPTRVEALKLVNEYSLYSSSFRFHTSDSVIHQLHWESSNITTGFISEPFLSSTTSTTSKWFTAAAASLLASIGSQPLHAYELPTPVSTFASKSTMPCGILVVLSIIDSSATPQWNTAPNNSSSYHNNTVTLQHNRFLARVAAEKLEATMPHEQGRVHRMNRQAEERRQQHSDMMSSIAERRERDERLVADAIASPKLSNQAVAEGCLAWLIQQGEIGRDWTIEKLAEAVLYLIAVDNREEGNEAKTIVEVLDEWMDWAAAGGMKRQQYHFLEERKVELCFASALVAMIQKNDETSRGKASVDMMECLRLWRKVRLG